MKRLIFIAPMLGALLHPAAAADVPKKAAAPAATSTSPLYVFVHGGAGITSTQSEIALPGFATGSPKVWPAGAMIGGGVGYLSSIGPLSFGVEAEANYDFTHASVGCVGLLPCLGSSKNSWFFAEKALFGITLSQILGYVPGNAQPANWPVPITVPATTAIAA